MEKLLFFILLCFTLSFQSQGQHIKLLSGNYHSYLQLNKTTQLPVHLSVEKAGKNSVLIIRNGEEKITLSKVQKKNDSIAVSFPDFDSELRFVIVKKKELKGYWINYNKGNNYRIPFYAIHTFKDNKPVTSDVNMTGKWETHFSPQTEDEDLALGIFNQKNNHLTGTFRTETGDYRFLEGQLEGNKFYLAAFDGSHAFLLKGSIKDSKIQGFFYSGNHFSTDFYAIYNPDFELRDPDSITTVKKDSNLKFQLKTLDGEDYIYPNIETKGKVVIIQIMGTWCPNCMDETNFYKELYAKYHNRGLEIISIGYEATDSFEEQVQKIKTLKERKQLNFTFLVGGKASKNLASQHFESLNEIISFPTSIFIGRDGEVKRVHTGFNGPSTGDIYKEYVEKTTGLIESLLQK